MTVLITKKQLAKKFHRHTSTIDRWVRDGILPRPIKIGPDPSPGLWDDAEVDERVEKLKAARPETEAQ